MELLRVPAPAKINLFLHIVGRRPDGYHLLQTAFQLLEKCDWLDFYLDETSSEIVLETPLSGVPPEQDLTVRAARLLQQATGSSLGARIRIDKQLPMGGGLGGGSSDAATTLIALNRLWQTGLSRQQLQEIGLKLGADVPFFIYGQTAWAEGVGEEFQPLSYPEAWYVVIEPGVSVPTAEIFADKGLTRGTPKCTIQVFAAHNASRFKNDMQSVVCENYPEVMKAIKFLSQYGEAKMSGSGASVFLELSSYSEAIKVLEAAKLGFTAWVSKSMSAHPIISWVV